MALFLIFYEEIGFLSCVSGGGKGVEIYNLQSLIAPSFLLHFFCFPLGRLLNCC